MPSKLPIPISPRIHALLRAYADRKGERVEAVLEAVINKYLDEKVSKA